MGFVGSVWLGTISVLSRRPAGHRVDYGALPPLAESDPDLAARELAAS